MLKKVYRKNGIIILMNKDTNDLREPYFIIQNYSKYKTLDELKKNYYQSIGFIYHSHYNAHSIIQ